MQVLPPLADPSYLQHNAVAPLLACVPKLRRIDRLAATSPAAAWNELCALREAATHYWWRGYSSFACALANDVPEATIELWTKDAKDVDPLEGDRNEVRTYHGKEFLIVPPLIEAALSSWGRTAERVRFMANHGAFDDEIAQRLCLTHRGVALFRSGWSTRRRRADRWTRERILMSMLLWRYCFGAWPTSTDWDPTGLRNRGDLKRLRRWEMQLEFRDRSAQAEMGLQDSPKSTWPRSKDVKEFGGFPNAVAAANDFEYAVVFGPLEGWSMELYQRKVAVEEGDAVAYVERLRREDAELYDDAEAFMTGWNPRSELLEFLQRSKAFDRRVTQPRVVEPGAHQPRYDDVPF